MEHTPRFPPGTTYEEIAEMVETGVAISPMDLMGLKDKETAPPIGFTLEKRRT